MKSRLLKINSQADISRAGWPLKDRTSEDETGLEEKTKHTFNLGSTERSLAHNKKKEIQVKLDGVSAPSTSQLGRSLDVFTTAGQRLCLSAALLDSGSKNGRTQSQLTCQTHFSETLKPTVFWCSIRFYAKGWTAEDVFDAQLLDGT